MSDPKPAQRVVAELLGRTQETELDCDEFHDNLAAWLEGALEEDLRALMEHHRHICPECEEERIVLARALGLEG